MVGIQNKKSKRKNSRIEELIIYASLHEESKEGWVWIPSTLGIKSDFVKIKNPKTGKSIICEKRTIDDNFIEFYNSRPNTREIISPEELIIVISGYYREKLGIPRTNEKIQLEISEVNCCVIKYLIAPFHHPNPFVRMSIILGFLSLGIGIISLVIALIGRL